MTKHKRFIIYYVLVIIRSLFDIHIPKTGITVIDKVDLLNIRAFKIFKVLYI